MADEIVNEICTLKGERLGDIFKTFTLLINNKHEIIQKDIGAILAAFKPQNYLQKHLRLKLVDVFKQNAEVDAILKSNDLFDIARALKFNWYFNQIEDCDAFVNEAMPKMSFCTRVKVVKQFSKNLKQQKTAEHLFAAINQRYDLNLAYIILPACSEKFIRMKIPSFRLQLPSDIFNRLFQLYPDLMKEYLEFVLDGVDKRKRAFRNYQIDRYERVFQKLASRDPKLFLKLFEKYDSVMPFLQLGRRTSKSLLKSDLPNFIKNYPKYSRITKLQTIIKFLSLTELESLQLTLFPKSLSGFFKAGRFENFLEVVRDLPKNLSEQIIMKNFNKTFGRPLTLEEFSGALSMDIVKLLPDDIRIKWIESKIPTIESAYDKAELISLLPTSMSIPQLKKLMEVQAEVAARAFMIKQMVRSIKFNGDINCLVEVVHYFIKRYRNDNIQLREKLFAEIYELEKLLQAMKVEDWDCINELLKLVKLYKEQVDHRYYLKYILMHKVKNFFKRGMPMEEHLRYYFEMEKYLFESFDFDLCKDTIYQKPCLLFFLSVVPNTNFPDKEKEISGINLLFERICSFNAKNKKDKIEVPDWMIKTAIEYMISPPANFFGKKQMVEHFKKDPLLKAKMFDEIFPAYISPTTLAYTLKNNPTKVINNLDKVLNKMFESTFENEYCSFLKPAKLYSPFGLPEKLISICLEKLNKAKSDESMDIGTNEDGDKNEDEDNNDNEDDGNNYSAKPNAIKILSLLVQSDIFVGIIEKYYPTTKEIDYSDDDDSLYRIQQEIASSLKNFNNPCDALVPLKKFAVGDYLKYVVGSINSISLQVSEEKIIPLLNEWMDSPVSVRKHFIRSFYKIAPKSAKSQLIKNFFPTEKNVSMRLLLFQHAFRFFSNEPCEESFEVFKFIQENLNEKDEQAVDKMYEIDKVPDEFVSRYLEMMWKLTNLKESTIGSNAKNKLIGLIDKQVLQLLNEEFCEHVLNQIFSMDNLENIHLLSFVCRYLLCSNDKDTQMARLDKTMSYLKPMITSHWNDYNLLKYTVFPVRNTLAYLIKDLCNESRDRDQLLLEPSSLLKEFKTHLKLLLQEESILEQLIIIDFTIAYHDHFVVKGDKPSSELYFSFTKTLLMKYSYIDSAVLLGIIDCAVPFSDLEGSKGDQENAYLVLCEKLLSDSVEACNVLGVKLTSTKVNEDYYVPHYKNILKLIFENPHSSVRICANTLLKNLVSTVRIA